MGGDDFRPQSVPGTLNILHLVTYAGETCLAYQQFSRSAIARHRNTICTYFRRNSEKSDEKISFFSGDGTLAGFFRALKMALDADHYDVIHVHYSFLSFFLILASVWLRRNLLRSTVYTVHTSYPNLKLRNRFFTAAAFASSRRIVFCSRASYESFPKWLLWLAGKRALIIQNGVDLDRIDARIGANAPSACVGDFIVVTVGRLIDVKNQRAIVQAFGRVSNVTDRLIIVGEGERRSSLQSLIDASGLSGKVCLTGLIDRDDVYSYLKHADVFVSSSRVEGLPVAVLEAMACGCPVILSDIPPHREIAQGAQFIPLVAPDDVIRLGEEIARFRQMSTSERKRIGAMCRTLVETHFSVSRMLEQYDHVYRQVSSAGVIH